ncbi:glycerophosphodiester phosphodiesterase family protein [Glutamicibacter sp. PS]|uniref:glycerophosphodiester phosphodiesterase n=1 Tax=Glutamicibacter sp. PS TaxID=3075634 RepID=UPI00284F6357|nr:glycerophosphodiester phosphodiesterase family protein [Glutamicibacter sp. PS]MDR4534759.1 glycerophosphodiester phosphodiesterase [Glutamicibacter sp. PS]
MEPQIFAHRGSSHRFAENTRAAYLAAIDEGADGVECDVHLSADGAVVCHHDPTVDRTSDATGLVSSYTVAQLKAMDFTQLGNEVLPDGYGTVHEQLVTLHELLELIDARGVQIDLAVELKHPSPFGHLLEDRVLQVLQEFGFDPATGKVGRTGQIQVSFMSFEPESMRYLARTVDRSLLCQLITEIDAEWVQELLDGGQVSRAAVYEVLHRSVAEGVELINSAGTGIIGPGVAWVRANESLVRTWLARGATARIWTVDRPADALYLMSLGVQQLTSNRPAALRRELAAAANG